MSLISFGTFILYPGSSRERLLTFIRQQNHIPGAGFYIHTEKERIFSSIKVMNSYGDCTQASNIVCFELNDSIVDNTVTDILSCRMYREKGYRHWVERTPTLWKRLMMIEQYFIRAEERCNVDEVLLYISEQGYSILSDYKELVIPSGRFAEMVYPEYIKVKIGTPNLRIRMSFK